mmetsp:Transcript_100724/g.291159  ORF Transcript_100724/g.291159 Transcript_100724/m.291159 type:complete len:246 (-) Transcript_100724:964-1701(-)
MRSPSSDAFQGTLCARGVDRKLRVVVLDIAEASTRGRRSSAEVGTDGTAAHRARAGFPSARCEATNIIMELSFERHLRRLATNLADLVRLRYSRILAVLAMTLAIRILILLLLARRFAVGFEVVLRKPHIVSGEVQLIFISVAQVGHLGNHPLTCIHLATVPEPIVEEHLDQGANKWGLIQTWEDVVGILVAILPGFVASLACIVGVAPPMALVVGVRAFIRLLPFLVKLARWPPNRVLVPLEVC